MDLYFFSLTDGSRGEESSCIEGLVRAFCSSFFLWVVALVWCELGPFWVFVIEGFLSGNFYNMEWDGGQASKLLESEINAHMAKNRRN